MSEPSTRSTAPRLRSKTYSSKEEHSANRNAEILLNSDWSIAALFPVDFRTQFERCNILKMAPISIYNNSLYNFDRIN